MDSTIAHAFANPITRGQAWGFLAAAMEYPEGELTELIRRGEIARQARQLFVSLYPELENRIDWNALADAGNADDLSIEYTRLFDVGGADGPPCALNSGAAKGDARMSLLEELVRFYNYFGLTAAGTDANELPDHLSTQFEFMYYLCSQQAENTANNEPADDYIRAQRDFVNHHPATWVPALSDALKQNQASAYYRALGELMASLIQVEQRLLEVAVSRLPPPEAHPESLEDEEFNASASAQGMDAPSSVITIHRKKTSASALHP
jgi:DMSO reductase family type II enzyme chaperone